nr:hypothetical protein [Anaerolineae bacterium]
MNIYVVVEGVTEQKVYKHWIPLINPRLTLKNYIDEIKNDDCYLITGGGYPRYFTVIENAISDVNSHTNFDRLVISIDSEEMSRDEKYEEIQSHLVQFPCRVPVKIVVQHFCFETWALGNRKIIRRNSQSSRLRTYQRFFNVGSQDPEQLPAIEDLSRAQFAKKYLIAALNDKYRNLTYSKSQPKALLHSKYLEQLQIRLDQTGHIQSFESFLKAFV